MMPRTVLAALLLLLALSTVDPAVGARPAHALTVTSDYVIDQPGTYGPLDLILKNNASLRVTASDVTLDHFDVSCPEATHASHAIIAGQVDRLILIDPHVSQHCGLDGIHLTGGAGHRILGADIRGVGGLGISLSGVTGASLYDWFVYQADGGVYLTDGTTGTVVAAGQGKSMHSRHAIYVDATSSGNVLLRNRGYGMTQGQADFNAAGPDNYWHHGICGEYTGFAACYFATGQPDADAGDPSIHPGRRYLTVCDGSFQGAACDYLSPQVAAAAALPGDLLVVDTHGSAGWGELVIVGPDTTWLGNCQCQKGTYIWCSSPNAVPPIKFTTLTVLPTATGVWLENFNVTGVLTSQPGTVLVDVY